MNGGRGRAAWWAVVGTFLGMALWPIWASRFPAMQDYPQHLWHAHVLQHFEDPAFDYPRYYQVKLRPEYAAFFLTTLLFARIVPLEIAGKLSLSLYPVLIAALVLRLGRRLHREHTPWGALLLFPFAFNQQYFYGNLNYLLSVPLLAFALLDLEDLSKGALGAWPAVRQGLWQLALFSAHPLSFLVYVSMAIVAAILMRRRVAALRGKVACVLGIAALLLAAFWFESRGIRPPDATADPRLGLLWPMQTLEYFVFMFDGMQSWGRAEAPVVIVWGATGALVLTAVLIGWRSHVRPSVPREHWVFLGMAIGGMFILPFGTGHFSHMNVRLAAVVYFLLALAIAQVRFQVWSAGALIVLLGTCMVQSLVKQAHLSAEVEEILPVVRRIPPRARILPLVFDRDSPELDPSWFDPHVQDPAYYHVLVGGGFNPYLLRAPVHPIFYKPGQARPAPGVVRPEGFDWNAHAADYQYFLVRAGPPGLVPYLSLRCDVIAQSGPWTLFERRPE